MNHSGGVLLAIASGKGGVGKTFLAITLCHALARSQRRVLLFDGDLGLANVDIQLGLLPARDIAGCLRKGESPLAAAQHHASGGFAIVSGRSGCGSLARLDEVELGCITAALREARLRYDWVVVDIGAGIDEPARRLAALSDRLLVVATDEPTSLTDAYAVLKLYAMDRGTAASRPGVVINLATTLLAGQQSYGTLARASQSFLGHTPELAGVVRRDSHVREAIRRQSLLLERSPVCHAAQDVEALAASLLSQSPHTRLQAAYAG